MWTRQKDPVEVVTQDTWYEGRTDPEVAPYYVFSHKDYPYVHGEQGKKDTEEMFRYFY